MLLVPVGLVVLELELLELELLLDDVLSLLDELLLEDELEEDELDEVEEERDLDLYSLTFMMICGRSGEAGRATFTVSFASSTAAVLAAVLAASCLAAGLLLLVVVEEDGSLLCEEMLDSWSRWWGWLTLFRLVLVVSSKGSVMGVERPVVLLECGFEGCRLLLS